MPRHVRAFGNRRIVEFNAGFLAVSDWLAVAMIADWAGHEGCLKEYSSYLAQLVGHNSRRAFKGKDRKQVYDFNTYAHMTHGQCEGRSRTPRTPRGSRNCAKKCSTLSSRQCCCTRSGTTCSIMSAAGTTTSSRSACARWRPIAGRSQRPSTPTTSCAPPYLCFLFIASTGGGTLEEEIRSSHPSGLHRIRDLLVQTRMLLDKKDPMGAHVLDASIEDLDRTLR
jgi:hypothetical protein